MIQDRKCGQRCGQSIPVWRDEDLAALRFIYCSHGELPACTPSLDYTVAALSGEGKDRTSQPMVDCLSVIVVIRPLQRRTIAVFCRLPT